MGEAQDPQKVDNSKRMRDGILLAALVISIMTVFSVIGTPLLNPLMPHSLSGVSLAVPGKGISAVVDQSRTRILFIDTDLHISAIARVGNGEVPIDEVSGIAVGDGILYVAGLRRGPDGEAITSEAVLSYSKNGTYLKTLWEESALEGSVQVAPTIVDLKADADGVVVARIAGKRGVARSVQLLRVDSDASQTELRTIDLGETVYDASYDIAQDRCYVITTTGASRAEDGAGGLKVVADMQELPCMAIDVHNGRVVMQDASTGCLRLFANPDDASEAVELEQTTDLRCAKLSDDALVVVQSNGSLLLRDLASQDQLVMTEIELSPRLASRFVSFGVSVTFLFVMLCVWGRHKIKELIDSDQRGRLREVTIALVAGILVVIVTNYLSFESIKSDWAKRERELLQMSSYLSYLSPGYLSEEDASELRSVSALRMMGEQSALKRFEGSVQGLVLAAHESDIGISCKIFALSENTSNAMVIFSTEHDVVPGERVFDKTTLIDLRRAYLAMGTAPGSTAAERALHANTLSSLILQNEALGIAYAPLVTSGGSCWGVAQISSRGVTFARQFVADALKSVLSFSVVAIGIFLLAEEFLKCGNATLNYRSLKTDGAEWSYTALSRPLSFLLGLASSMDYALVAVMASDILKGAGTEPSSLVLSLPFLAATVGSMLAQFLYSDLSKYLSVKGFMAGTSAVGVAGECLCVYALASSRIDLYILGRFILNMGYGLAWSELYGIPFRAPSGSMQLYYEVEEAVKSSGLMAGVLGGLVVGLGNGAIYLTAGIFGVVLFCCSLCFMPSDRVRDFKEKRLDKEEIEGFVETKKEDRKLSNAFLFSSPMLLSILFGMVPVTIAGGYRSYVFPLFLSSANLSKSQIANLWVICDSLQNLIVNELRPFRETHNRWFMSWIGMVALGATFALFAQNQSIAWAILAAIVIGLLRWFAGSCRYCARKIGQEEYGLGINQAFAIVTNTDSVVKNVRSVAMGAFLSLGTVSGCLALGVYLAVSGLIYAVTTRSHYERALKK